MTGNGKAKYVLRGKINRLKEINGYSAYEIALIYGFEGTEEEWLASLKGDKGDKGDKGEKGDAVADLTNYYTKEEVNSLINPATSLTEITILASAWVGEDSPYSQVVQVAGVTDHSKVDLQPSVEQLAIFHEKDLAFVTENEDGVVTVYAIGDKPQNDYTMQATITEVVV